MFFVQTQRLSKPMVCFDWTLLCLGWINHSYSNCNTLGQHRLGLQSSPVSVTHVSLRSIPCLSPCSLYSLQMAVPMHHVWVHISNENGFLWANTFPKTWFSIGGFSVGAGFSPWESTTLCCRYVSRRKWAHSLFLLESPYGYHFFSFQSMQVLSHLQERPYTLHVQK